MNGLAPGFRQCQGPDGGPFERPSGTRHATLVRERDIATGRPPCGAFTCSMENRSSGRRNGDTRVDDYALAEMAPVRWRVDRMSAGRGGAPRRGIPRGSRRAGSPSSRRPGSDLSPGVSRSIHPSVLPEGQPSWLSRLFENVVVPAGKNDAGASAASASAVARPSPLPAPARRGEFCACRRG